MQVLILGAAGFLGTRLVRTLRERPDALGGAPITGLCLTDLRDRRPGTTDPATRFVAGDLRDPALLDALFETPPDTIVHLAATLTLDAEADLALGLDVNVLALIGLLDRCRRLDRPPRLLFASSISTFGGPLPAVVDDRLHQTPQTSYGAHKVIAEQLIGDLSRRGCIDGRALRLPIVLTHPGPPTASVSDRIAALIREPLAGRDTTCPLAPDTPLAIASARTVVDGLLRLHALPTDAFETSRTSNLPALTTTPAELAQAAQRRAAADGRPAGRVHWRADPAVQAVVAGWPSRFVSSFGARHGLRPDRSVDAIVDDHLDSLRAG